MKIVDALLFYNNASHSKDAREELEHLLDIIYANCTSTAMWMHVEGSVSRSLGSLLGVTTCCNRVLKEVQKRKNNFGFCNTCFTIVYWCWDIWEKMKEKWRRVKVTWKQVRVYSKWVTGAVSILMRVVFVLDLLSKKEGPLSREFCDSIYQCWLWVSVIHSLI